MKDNDGSFRAFEKYNYRVTYKVKETEIIIARVRHISREPLETKNVCKQILNSSYKCKFKEYIYLDYDDI